MPSLKHNLFYGQNYQYATVQDGNTCICENSVDLTTRVSNSNCKIACVGDSALYCGGENARIVYDVTLEAGV